MYNNSLFEKQGTKNRIIEIIALFLFIVISLIISVCIMNLLILPIALLATEFKESFNFTFKCTFWIITILSFLLIIIKKIRQLKHDAIPSKEIIKKILLKPFFFLLTSVVTAITGLILILLVKLALESNYYLLYKLIN